MFINMGFIRHRGITPKFGFNDKINLWAEK